MKITPIRTTDLQYEYPFPHAARAFRDGREPFGHRSAHLHHDPQACVSSPKTAAVELYTVIYRVHM